jgi:hypothetical protein
MANLGRARQFAIDGERLDGSSRNAEYPCGIAGSHPSDFRHKLQVISARRCRFIGHGRAFERAALGRGGQFVAAVKVQGERSALGERAQETSGIEMSPHHPHSREHHRRQTNVIAFLLIALALAAGALVVIAMRADGPTVPPGADMPVTRSMSQ